MNNDDVVIVLPSDHYIKDVNAYIEVSKIALDFSSNNDAIVTLGIKPTKAETGYGYIEVVVDENGILVTRRGTTQDVKNVKFDHL